MVDHVLPAPLIPRFQSPHGRLYPGSDPPVELDPDRPLLAVGDITVANLLRRGYVPAVMVLDGQTRRHEQGLELPELPEGTLELKVTNPAGRLGQQLWSALVMALDHPGPVEVRVEGEEDLATLALMALAPLGCQIAYGQPGQGLVVMDLDETFRAKAYELLQMMEED